jgi:hypothetical protein
MPRLIAGCVAAALTVAGMPPCAVSLQASTAQHDCCDPEQLGGDPGDPAALARGGAPGECCVASATAPVPAGPVAGGNPAYQAAAPATSQVPPFFAPARESRPNFHDAESRSAPRSPLVTVLLI